MTGLNPALEYHVVNSLGWPELRPLQKGAVEPVRDGKNCLLIAPTAGGKTEAAIFPLLSEMVEEDWHGLSVLYVTPLKALLNNLLPRLEQYAAWLGRTVGLWHGDVGSGERQRMQDDRPDILLTTPESLEAMLVSRRVDHRSFFSGVRAIVVDELHAFAGADRGWHLLAVLERIQRVSGAGAPIQRIGLSATVGNPEEMLAWLSAGSRVDGTVVTGDDPSPSSGSSRGAEGEVAGSADSAPSLGVVAMPPGEITLDYVGTVANAAEVISRLHRGEKRLVFCESRAQTEELAFELRERGVTTFVSHSSLSVDERRVSERAFAEARDCVIVATSTLELGIDIGDLDRMIQIGAPRSVAAFLQRLGRTGRRAGSVRHALFLAESQESFLRACGLLLLWGRGYVEPVIPPPSPRHIAAQQLLALALQEGRFGRATWKRWWGQLPLMDDAEEVLAYLIAEEFLVEDQGLLMIGPRAEREFGRRHFMDLLATFTADLELRVVSGRREIGTISPLALRRGPDGGAARILLAGWTWQVEDVNWARHEVMVSPLGEKGKARWDGGAVGDTSVLAQAQREVLLGATPDVVMSRRAASRLTKLREELSVLVDPAGTVLVDVGERRNWWTWAGERANETLASALGHEYVLKVDSMHLGLAPEVALNQLRGLDVAGVVPFVPAGAVDGLKFSAALPEEMARKTLAERLADRARAALIANQSIILKSPTHLSDLQKG